MGEFGGLGELGNIERPRALDFPLEPMPLDEPPEIELPDPVDMNRVRQAFEKHGFDNAKWLLHDAETTRRQKHWERPVFDSNKLATIIDFVIHDTEDNKGIGVSGIDYGTYRAIYLPLTDEEESKIKETSVQAKAAEINTDLDQKARDKAKLDADNAVVDPWKRIRNDSRFKRWLGHLGTSDDTFLVGTFPPNASTDYQMVAFFLHPSEKYYIENGYDMAFDYSMSAIVEEDIAYANKNTVQIGAASPKT